jgi:glycosyltransferase involved in cell wall biosynthesis
LIVDKLPNYTISVVITAYNAARWIRETLDSVLAQTYPPLEIIVVDDGSTDESASIIQQYGSSVRYIYQKNQGQPDARNVGIRAALGEYIAFVDADDLWKPEKLDLQVEKLKEGYQWVICGFISFDDATRQSLDLALLKMYQGDCLEQLLQVNFIGSPTPVVKREIFEDVGYFNNSMATRIGEDWQMWLRIAEKYPLGVVRRQLALRRAHVSSAMASANPTQKVENLKNIVNEAVERQPARLGKLKARALSNLDYTFGIAFFEAERYTEARSLFHNVIQQRPYHLSSLAYLTMISFGPGFSKPVVRWKRRFFTWLKGMKRSSSL